MRELWAAYSVAMAMSLAASAAAASDRKELRVSVLFAVMAVALVRLALYLLNV